MSAGQHHQAGQCEESQCVQDAFQADGEYQCFLEVSGDDAYYMYVCMADYYAHYGYSSPGSFVM